MVAISAALRAALRFELKRGIREFVQEFIGERRAAQKEALEGNVGDLKLECEGIVADLRSPQYATFQQDVDTIVEDLQERVAHIQELVSASEKFQAYCEEFSMPEVISSRPCQIPCLYAWLPLQLLSCVLWVL